MNDPLRDLRGSRRAGAAEKDGELVAAKSCAQVLGTDGPAQALRDVPEQVVTRSVTEQVVHVLEVVEVDEQDRRVPGGLIVENSRQRSVERRAVGQPGETVQGGLHRQLLVDLTVAQRQCHLVPEVADRVDRLGGHELRRTEQQPRAARLVVHIRQRYAGPAAPGAHRCVELRVDGLTPRSAVGVQHREDRCGQVHRDAGEPAGRPLHAQAHPVLDHFQDAQPRSCRADPGDRLPGDPAMLPGTQARGEVAPHDDGQEHGR